MASAQGVTRPTAPDQWVTPFRIWRKIVLANLQRV
jgi:hypothetical protein